MTPLLGFVGVALLLALNRFLRRLGDRLEAVLLEHLPRDRVNLRLGYHVALLMFRRSEPQHRFPPVAGSLSNGPIGVSFRPTLENNCALSSTRAAMPASSPVLTLKGSASDGWSQRVARIRTL